MVTDDMVLSSVSHKQASMLTALVDLVLYLSRTSPNPSAFPIPAFHLSPVYRSTQCPHAIISSASSIVSRWDGFFKVHIKAANKNISQERTWTKKPWGSREHSFSPHWFLIWEFSVPQFCSCSSCYDIHPVAARVQACSYPPPLEWGNGFCLEELVLGESKLSSWGHCCLAEHVGTAYQAAAPFHQGS